MLIATESLSRLDKLRLIEQFWDELSREPDSLESPHWHGEALAEAENALAKGQAAFMDWAKAKVALREDPA